ncbi:hypothetical protein V6N11_064747 [Hibiscus sabdariffa]|uniref:Uncharacterized protein n=1 Tax=Hibiscus sabdariffa TaxID=183260 RepID=A0ABR2SHW5_9ROSI
MPWQYQPCYEHSNPLEQMLPTFTTSFDRLLEEMPNLNKSMEARLVKMDERMINWGGSTSVMDNMPKGTEIPRQEVGEQCEKNPSMPTHHARAGVTANAWAEIATGSNATTTSHDAAKSDASANSTESDAENDTITLTLKHEPINCSHPQFSRQPCGIKETTCPGSKHTFCLGSEEVVCHGNEELACPGSTEATCLGSPEVARPGSRQAACPGSTEAACPGSTEAFCPGSTRTACLGGEEIACPGSTKATCLGSTRTAHLGSEETTCPGSTKATCPGSTKATCPGSEETARPGSKQTACLCSEEPVCPDSTQKFYPGSTDATYPDSTESICPGSKLTFCFSGEQNDCFNGNCLSIKTTDCLENEAQSMVIPPTIYAAPKSLLMEMFKKSDDNHIWKLDDFKKYVPSIDFHRILAKDCHGNWLEQQLPQQRRLHPTMLEGKANEVIKWLDVITIFPNPIFMPSGKIARWSEYRNFKEKGHKNISTMAAQREVAEIPLAQVFLGRIVTRWKFLPRHHHQKTDLAQRIDRSKKRRLTFMAYSRDYNKVIIQVIKNKVPRA